MSHKIKVKKELKTIQRIKNSFPSFSTVKFFFDFDPNKSLWEYKHI